jgi:hypothetical protein
VPVLALVTYADLVRLNADREAAKHGPLWETSSSCTQIDRKSRSFCDHVAGLDREIKTNAAIVDAGRPGNADPQASTWAWVTHLPQEAVAKATPLLIAAAFEITAMGLFFAAEIEHEESKSPPDQQPPPAENPVVEIEAQIRAAIEAEQIAKAEVQKAEAKREQSRQHRLRRKAQLEAAKKPKRKRRKKKPPSPKPPALRLVR